MATKKPQPLPEPTLIRLKVSEILPWSENPRDHDASQIKLLKKSLDHFGLVALPIVQKGTRRLIAGHGRIQALQAAGFGDRDIPVLEVDLNDEDATAYTITDNRLTDLSEWRMPELKAALVELDNGAFDMEWCGYDEASLKKLFPDDDDDDAHGDGDGDGEGKPKTGIRPGDTVVLGDNLALQIGEKATPEDLDIADSIISHWEEHAGGHAKVLRHGKEAKR